MRCETKEQRIERLRVYRERWKERAAANAKVMEDIARDQFLMTDHHHHVLQRDCLRSILPHGGYGGHYYEAGLSPSGPLWLGFGEGRSFYGWDTLKAINKAAVSAILQADREKQSSKDKAKHQARKEHEDALAQAKERTQKPSHKAVQFLNRTHLWGEATLLVTSLIAAFGWLYSKL